MATITGAAIVDRVRALCQTEPFFYQETDDPFTFDLTPSQALETPVFRIEPLAAEWSMGQTGFREDRIDRLTLWVARDVALSDHALARTAALNDVHSLTARITRDAYVTSGDYGILDDGKESSVQMDRGAQFVVLRLSLPVQYEITL